MREIVVAVNSQDKINLGYLGENNYQVVKFDITDWLREHENGKAVLLFKVNGMDDPYPCKVEIQGNYANWILTKADLQQGRNGKCQLIYYADGEAIAKSSIFCTDVANSLGEQTTEPPEAFTSWVNDVLIAGLQAENAVKSAVQIQQQMNETLLSAQQTFEAAVRQGLSSIEDAKEQVAQQAEQSVDRLDETADAANRTVLDALTEGLHQIDTAQTQAVMAVTDEGGRQAEKLRALVPDGYYTKEESDQRYAQIDDAKFGVATTWSSQNIVSRICPSFEVSGSIVTCNPVKGSPLNVLVQIEPVQEGTGDPSPENVRPIQGFNTVNVVNFTGKNLIDFMSAIPYGDGTIEILENGVKWSGTFSFRMPVSFPLKKGETITASWVSNVGEGQKWRAAYPVGNSSPTRDNGKSLQLDDPRTVSEIIIYKNADWENRGENMVYENIQLEYGAQSTSYEPFSKKNNIVTISLGQMVYGGMLDVTTGVLTKTHENIPSYAGEDVGDDWMSSTGDLTNGAQVVYRLPQPEIIQLDPVEIAAFSGVNTVYADTGDVTVSGYSDPNTIINALTKRISALEQNVIGG